MIRKEHQPFTWGLAVLLAAFALASLSHAGDNEGAVVEKLLADYAKAYNAGDSAALSQTYAEDAVMLPPNGEIIRGRLSIETFWRSAMGKGLKLELAGAKLDRTVGYGFGTYSFPPGPSGPGPRGKFMVGLKKLSGGAWKIAADTWNEPRPTQPD